MASVAEGKWQAINISDVIDQRPISAFQILTVVMGGFVLILDGFDSLTITYVTTSIASTTNIPLHSFGPVISASLFGLMIAAMTTGPIADRWGRKWPVIFSTLSFALFSLLTAHANTRTELIVLRFLTGLGLGGAMPNVVALASEYVPKRLLSVVIPILFIGMPLGGTISGFTARAIIPIWGWRSLFVVGGMLPLGITLLLIIVLPESIQFLAVRGRDSERIAKTLARIAPELAQSGANFVFTSREDERKGVPVKYLFAEGRTAGTIFLWIPYFMNLLLIYFLSGWLPILLRDEGMSVSAGVTAATFISFGGVFGCLIEGRLLRRWGAYVILSAEYAVAGLLIVLLATIRVSFPLMLTTAFATGLMIIGAQGGLNALSARFYPISVRSTGVGWALGVGRIGSIVGPLMGGALSAFGWLTRGMLLFAAVVAAIACASIVASLGIRSNATAYSPASDLGGR